MGNTAGAGNQFLSGIGSASNASAGNVASLINSLMGNTAGAGNQLMSGISSAGSANSGNIAGLINSLMGNTNSSGNQLMSGINSASNAYAGNAASIMDQFAGGIATLQGRQGDVMARNALAQGALQGNSYQGGGGLLGTYLSNGMSGW